MAFKELMENFSVTISSSGYSATRTFIDLQTIIAGAHYTDLPGTTISTLPEIGTALTSSELHNTFLWTFSEIPTLTNLKLKSVKSSILQGTWNTVLYTLDYSSAPDEDTNCIQFQLTVQGEYITLPSSGSVNDVTFSTIVTPATVAGKVNTFRRKWIPKATLTKQKISDTPELACQFNTGLSTSYYSDYIGKVQYFYANDGYWLFENVNIDEIITRDGSKKYRTTEVYKYMKITGTDVISNGGGDGGWNLVYDPIRAVFDTTSKTSYVVTANAQEFPLWPVPLI